MSWHFSQALEAAFSAGTCSDGALCVPWSKAPFARDDSCSDKMKGTFHRSPFGMMFAPLTEPRGAALLMWCQRAGPARTSAKPGTGGDYPGNAAVFGLRRSELFATFDRDLYCWKTLPSLLGGDSEPYCAAWPKQGFLRNGECFAAVMSAPTTKERAGSAWLTPTVEDFKRRGSSAAWQKYKLQGATTNARLRNQAQQSGGAGYLTVEFAESLMWWPIGWTGAQRLETDRFRQWSHWHGAC